jgi:hypothetical protein
MPPTDLPPDPAARDLVRAVRDDLRAELHELPFTTPLTGLRLVTADQVHPADR